MFAQQSGSDSSVLNVTLALGMLVAAGGLALVWDKVRGRLSFPAVYTAVFLAVMTGFLFLPFFDAGYRMLFAGMANAAFSLVSIFMMVTCIKIAHLRQVDPIAVFGVFSSIVYGGVLIGRAVGDALGRTYDISQILVIALMSTYVLSFAGVVVNMRRKGKVDREFDRSGEPLNPSLRARSSRAKAARLRAHRTSALRPVLLCATSSWRRIWFPCTAVC